MFGKVISFETDERIWGLRNSSSAQFFFLVVHSVLLFGDSFRKLDEYLGLFSSLRSSHAVSSLAKIVKKKQISEEDCFLVNAF